MDLKVTKPPRWLVVIPNGLTFSRLLVGFIFPFAGHRWRIVLLLYAGISDLIDGEISRRLDAATRFGRLLDPVADKAVVLSVAGTLLWEGSIVWWELLLVALRDVAVLAITMIVPFLKLREPMETSPLTIGKVTTAAQFAYLTTALMFPQIYLTVLVVTAATSCLAAFAYLQDAAVQVRNLRQA